MGLALKEAVEAVAGAAGWKITTPDESGVYHYLLEEGLDLDLASPDGRTLILSADLGGAPQSSEPGVDEEWKRIGRLAAAVLRKRASILSCHAGRLELYRTVILTHAEPQEIIEACKDFLNDQAWWRANLNSNTTATTASPFSFAQGWFPGQLNF